MRYTPSVLLDEYAHPYALLAKRR